MKRFRARSVGPQSVGWKFRPSLRVLAACIWGVGVIVYLIWIGRPPAHADSETLDKASTRQETALAATYTGLSWHGHPVYYLRNPGPLVAHLNVYSWSEDELPVLYVGLAAPSNLPTRSALTNPPFTLNHGEKLWFVGERRPPRTFTVTWEDTIGVHFTTVRASSDTTGSK